MDWRRSKTGRAPIPRIDLISSLKDTYNVINNNIKFCQRYFKYIEEDMITNSMVLVRLLLIWIRHFNAVGVVVNRPITLENCTSLHC